MSNNMEDEINKVIEALASNIDDFALYDMMLDTNQSMLEMLLDSFFRKIEGSPCSHDKTMYVIRKIKQALKERKHCSLKETYDIEKHPQMKEHANEIAYWCPSTFEDTKEVLDFVAAYITMNDVMLKKIMTKIIERNKKND